MRDGRVLYVIVDAAERFLTLPVRALYVQPGEEGAAARLDMSLAGEIAATGDPRENRTESFPPSVLAHGRFPPLTRWQVEHPPAEGAADAGFVRREPTEERRRLHQHRWEPDR